MMQLIRIGRAACFLATIIVSMASRAAELNANRTVDLRDLVLPSVDGSTLTIANDFDLQVICFLGCECPLAKVYGPRLQRMSEEFASQRVRFVGINSNVQDSMDDVKKYVSKHAIQFSVAKDFDRQVALRMNATRTPQVFVVDKHGAIRYQGRIDDQYRPGITRKEPSCHDLRDAIEQLLAGKVVATPVTEAVGCLIALPKKNMPKVTAGGVTFCDQVSRVLNEHCVDCHREGEIGPFALEQYDEVVGWSDMMLEVMEQRRMPPWHADSDHGSFANARQMPQRDQQVLRDWVAAGTPYGNADDLPEPKERVVGWRLPKEPDAVYRMPNPFSVPAEGTVEYQYSVVDPKFEEDKWIRAIQVVPGNASVVHHCIAFARPPDGGDIRDFGFLSAYVPGQRSTVLPDGYAIRVPARSKIVFQMHYTPTGMAETDQTKIGVIFAEPNDVTHQVSVTAGLNQGFEIPPHAKNHEVSGSIGGLPKDGLLLSIIPHMHLRGKSFRMTYPTEDEQTRMLLHVPRYDFNWQHNYQLSEPMPLSKVRSLDFVATFDNSVDNPANPDADEYVNWGDQTWQEMAVTFVTVAQPRVAKATQRQKPTPAEIAAAEALFEQQVLEAESFADEYIERLDKNGDGAVALHELPSSVRRHEYLDHDGDGQVSRDELVEAYSWRHPFSQ